MNIHDWVPLEPTPQDYGFPENPLPRQAEVWHRQELFLVAYEKLGKHSSAAKEAGITAWCVDKWIQADRYSIRKRMQLAHQRYVESLEQLMDDRLTNPTGNRGSDVLLMFKLKAEAPEKYREEVKVLGVSAPLQMLEKLKELAAKDMREREALEAPAVEGEFKEVVALKGGKPPVIRTQPSEAPAVTPSPPPAPAKQEVQMKKRGSKVTRR
jgi:hypothetical protein